MDYAAARKVMVDSQVRVNDVTDRAVQGAMLAVPREQFVPAERAFAAYAEVEVEIAAGRKLMLARDLSKLLQNLDAREGETVLAIAAPYAAAVLARMGLKVTAQESDAAVFEVSGAALADAGVETVVAPLNQPAAGEWDIIISEGAVAVRPESWISALKIGGRLVVVERPSAAGKAVLYVRGSQGVSRRELFNAHPDLLNELTPEPVFAL